MQHLEIIDANYPRGNILTNLFELSVSNSVHESLPALSPWQIGMTAYIQVDGSANRWSKPWLMVGGVGSEILLRSAVEACRIRDAPVNSTLVNQNFRSEPIALRDIQAFRRSRLVKAFIKQVKGKCHSLQILKLLFK